MEITVHVLIIEGIRMSLKIRFRFDARCILHPRYDPGRDGRPQHRNCEGCESSARHSSLHPDREEKGHRREGNCGSNAHPPRRTTRGRRKCITFGYRPELIALQQSGINGPAQNNKCFAILSKLRLAEENAMENDAGDKKKVLSPQEESAKAAILAECDKLAKAGVTFVAVHFDGYGDDGATEEV